MSHIGNVAAPATGQPKIRIASPPWALVDNTRTANRIKFSETEPRGLDARVGRALVRYLSDPRADAGTPGLWRTVGTGPREQISPYALVAIAAGRQGVEIEVVLPATGDERTFEGPLDRAATDLWRAGRRFGCQAERKCVFWALREFFDQAHRQAAARGVAV